MCGFAGIYAPQGAIFSPRTLGDMAEAIRHRGPDDQGFCQASFSRQRVEDLGPAPSHVALAFNRLSIVDLTPAGHQPMRSDDGAQVVVFNGEIYNAPDIRRELEAKGEHFRGHSDTEVLFRGILREGLEPWLHKTNGMFAFAYVDARRGMLSLVRDRLGIKPLYWWSNGREVLFASEVKAFLRHPAFRSEIDERRLDEYFAFRYCAHDRFLLKGVRQVAPGAVVTFDGAVEPGVRRWWTLGPASAAKRLSGADAADAIESQIERSVQMQLMSDVPLGCQLSGGIDSSLVTVFANRHAARPGQFQGFAISVDDPRLNEDRWIDDAARTVGVQVHKFPLRVEDFVDRVQQATWHLDQPLNHPNSIGIMLLAEGARKLVTVLLSGEGADEVFAGYPRFLRLKLLPVLRQFAPALGWVPRLGKKLAPFHPSQSADAIDWFLRATAQMHPGVLKELRPSARFDAAVALRRETFPAGGSLLSRCIRHELNTYVVDLLVRQDKMTMAASVENRVPLLDHDLVNLAAQLAESELVQPVRGPRLGTKVVLKRVARRHFSRTFVTRPKQAFGMPLRRIFATEGFATLMNDLVLPGTKRRGLVDRPAVEALWTRARTDGVAAEALWTCVALELWSQQFVDAPANRAGELPRAAKECA